MNKRIALLILAVSFSGLSARPSDGPKKYAFKLIQQTEARFEDKLNRMQNAFEDKIKIIEAGVNTEGFLNLSAEDKGKLKYLLHQVIAYK